MHPNHPTLRIGVLLLAVVSISTGLSLAAKKQKAEKRARAPKIWDKQTTQAFDADAFARTQGARPQVSAAKPGGSETPGGVVPPENRGGGFAWSDLISATTVTNEIKSYALTVQQNTRSPGVFKGGGNRIIRREFSILAAMFRITAEFDGDIRWKKRAAGFRDAFAVAGRNSKAGDDNTYKEAKARSDDLSELVRGGSVELDPRSEEMKWHRIAERRPLMQRLEIALDKRLRPLTANKSEFEKNRDQVRHEAELIAALAEVIQREEYEFYDDDVYLGYSKKLQAFAQAAAQAAKDNNFAEVQRSAGEISKSCSACHEDYK